MTFPLMRVLRNFMRDFCVILRYEICYENIANKFCTNFKTFCISYKMLQLETLIQLIMILIKLPRVLCQNFVRNFIGKSI